MLDVCLGFEVHQPLRLDRGLSEKDLEKGESGDLFDLYFDNSWNKEILSRVAEKCYLPANEVILDKIKEYEDSGKKFKVAYSISGVLVEQCERWEPEVLDSFKKLAESDCVEFLDQTYYHSLASLYSSEKEEFVEQVSQHRGLMKDLFNCEPRVFENTEFIYNNSIAKTLDQLSYDGVFTEGVPRVLDWRSPNYVYKAEGCDIKTLLRDYRLSDDIAFRFSERKWPEWPLTADKYADWLASKEGQCVNVFVDYETFGEHQWAESGIFDFLSWLPDEVLKHEDLRFVNPSDLVERDSVGEVGVGDFETVSWADLSRSTDAWLGNSMQRSCYQRIKEVGDKVKETGDEELLEIWRFLQTSDHLYYMYTRPGAPEEVHQYFSQQPASEAFRALDRILSDFEERVERRL